MCVHPINSQSLIKGLNSIKYFSKSFDSISEISKVAKPGVSAIYVFFSISYSFIVVVVFLPLLFF